MNSPVPANKLSCAGFVLAGGKSSRLGVEKAFLEIGGAHLLDRAIKVLGAVCSQVSIVGDPEKFESYGPVVADVYRDCGPLGGIHAAVSKSEADLNLIMAVDMPFVSLELLTFLRDKAAASDAGVTIPRTEGGLQPLCAVYRSAFAAVAGRALRERTYKIDALFSQVSVLVIEPDELIRAGFSERAFFNVNTPDDLNSARGG